MADRRSLGIPRERVDQVDEQAREWLSSGDGLVSSVGVDQARTALAVLGGLLFVVLVFFFMDDGDRIWGWFTRRMGSRAGPHADEAGRRAWGPRRLRAGQRDRRDRRSRRSPSSAASCPSWERSSRGRSRCLSRWRRRAW